MVKNPPANAGDTKDAGLIPGLGRSSGGGNGNPLQYSCLENPVDRGVWWATVCGVPKRRTQPSNWARMCYQFCILFLLIYLAVLGLSCGKCSLFCSCYCCGIQTLSFSMQNLVPCPGIEPRPWQWKCQFLTNDAFMISCFSRVWLFVMLWTVPLCPWDSLGKNTGVSCHFLFQGIFPTQGANPNLLHWLFTYWATWEALSTHTHTHSKKPFTTTMSKP